MRREAGRDRFSQISNPNAVLKSSLNIVKCVADHGELLCVDTKNNNILDQLPLRTGRLIVNGGDPSNLHQFLPERLPVRLTASS